MITPTHGRSTTPEPAGKPAGRGGKIKTMMRVEDVNSRGIEIECEKLGLTEIELLAADGVGDDRIRVFQVGPVRVLDTNADPVWEEDDIEGFAEVLEERGIEL